MAQEILTMLFRTVILYTAVIFLLRLAGKREIGQISIFDLVVAIMIAELAAIPMEDTSKPLINGLIPMTTLIMLEISFSYIALKSRRARGIIEGAPSIVVEKGKIIENEMRRLRYGVSDLVSQLREKGVYTLDDVEYAVLETNGKLSVIYKSDRRPVTPKDLGLTPPYEGLPITLIIDGEVEQANLRLINQDEEWLRNYIKKQEGCEIKDIIYAVQEPVGKLVAYKKGYKKQTP
jgi:uncharacterized membrane protein YcaP (DUF421 family)